MIFRNFAETIIGSKVKVKILMYMLGEGVPTSERELARILNVSHMAVNKAMKEFCDLNLISPFKIGNVLSWKLNEKSYTYEVVAVESLRKMAVNPPLYDLKTVIREKLSSWNLRKVIIFGSVAEGREEPDSDIDLLVITKNGKEKNPVIVKITELSDYCVQRYGNKLSPYILTEKEAKKTTNRRILKGAKRGMVVLPGVLI